MTRLFVVHSALEAVESESRNWRWRETGGPLFGYWSEPDDLVVVRAAISKAAVRSTFRFESDLESDWELIAEVVRDSEGAFTYVGDWHSHPWGGCIPSRRDLETVKMVAASPDADTPRPLAWIAGRSTPLHRRLEHGMFLLSSPEGFTAIAPRWLWLVPGS